MLGDNDFSAALAVKDMAKAKEFYGGKLGLSEAGSDPGGTYYKSGNTKFLVYESQYAGTNKATAAGWEVKDVPAMIKELKAKGISFEHYPDMPGVKMEGDVHVMGTMKAAWFKDPDGNILVIGNNQ